MVKCRWSMQIKHTRADCCAVSAAFARQDKELNEACLHASALESKWVHLDWVSPVTGQCMYANTAEDAAVLVVSVKQCYDSCWCLWLSMAADQLGSQSTDPGGGGRLSNALGCSCEQLPPPSNPQHPLSLLSAANCHPLPLGKWRWVLLMSVNPDYQAERHQLCPFSAQNTYSVCSSNRAIHTNKHMKCMNKPQREMKW